MINKTEWLQSGSLLYRLTNGRRPENTDEINITMADGSRSVDACALRATELLAALAQPDEVPEGCTPADAMVLREANHALAMELHEAKAALAQPAPVAQPLDEDDLISCYFAEPWAQDKARSMLDEFKRAHKIGGPL